jgi:hypothetical protein
MPRFEHVHYCPSCNRDYSHAPERPCLAQRSLSCPPCKEEPGAGGRMVVYVIEPPGGQPPAPSDPQTR